MLRLNLFILLLITISFSLQAQTYCNSNGERPWEEWISYVQFSNIDHISGKSSDYSRPGYSDYTDLAAYLLVGNTVDIQLMPGFSGATANMTWRVAIDFNKDGDFGDAGETVLERVGGSDIVRASIMIPTTTQ